MNVLDNLKEFFMPADDTEQDAVSSASAEEERVRETPVSSPSGSSGYSRPSQSMYDDMRDRRTDRYATIKTNVQFQVVLVKATTYTGDSKKVADYLIQGKTVVLNLEDIEESEKRRIIDFVVGAASFLRMLALTAVIRILSMSCRKMVWSDPTV